MSYSYFAVPTEESLNRLKDILGSAPIRLDFDKFAVRIAMQVSSDDPAPAGTEYSATISWFGQKYNEELEHSELVGILECPELVGRHIQLSGSRESWQPMLVFQSPATPLAQSNKFFINSLAGSLVKEEAFTFVERVLSD